MAIEKESKYYTENKAPGDPQGAFSPKPSFFDVYYSIDPDRWNRSFPYQLKLLLVAEKQEGSRTAHQHQPGTSADQPSYDTTGWNFTLPIPPQELNIAMPFGSVVEATLDGVVEQHGGAPFRDITLNGTTGITPVKNNADPMDNLADSMGARTAKGIFAGTVGAVSNFARDARTVATGNRFSTTSNINDGLGEDATPNKIPKQSTGYYQFRLLQKFLETYAELKKKNTRISIDDKTFHTKDLRLAFCITKDESIYICTPVAFMMRRSASNPMEYMYTIQLRAWKRVRDTDVGVQSTSIEIGKRSPNLYAQLMTRASAAVDTINDITSVHKSIIQDPSDRLNEICRTTSLFLKATNGANASLSDMPKHFQKDLIGLVSQNWKDLRDQLSDLSIGGAPPSHLSDAVGKKTKTPPPGGTPGGKNKDFAQLSNDQIDQILRKLKVNDLKMPSALAKQVQDEISKSKNQTRLDFENQKKEIDKLMADFSDGVGAGTVTYAETYNRPLPTVTRDPSDDEFNLLFALNELSTIMSHLAATYDTSPQTPTSMEYVAGLAAASGVAFRVPKSKYAVPMPYGVSLERLALQYLGDANRWSEIATLNGLRSPYVDEVGFTVPFITNGNGNTLFVASRENLYIGQTVWVSSNTQIKTKRHIVNIEELSLSFISVTIDGDAIDAFVIAEQAQLEAFLPNTVNSQQSIYIPSDSEAPTDLRAKAIPGVDEFDPLLEVSGIDLLLDQSGDLVIGSDGDCRFAYGLQNLIQTIKIALSTPKGSLLQHPSFGIAIPVGSSTADVDAKSIIKSITSTFENDPSFEKVVSATANKNGPALEITLVVKAKGLSGLIPVTFSIIQ
jgi:hypothetical protein